MNRIYFPLASSFPTVKAYGVTTARTAEASTKMKYKVQILTPATTGVDEYSNEYLAILPAWLQLGIDKIFKFSEVLAFRIQRISCSMYLIRIGKSAPENSIFWCRDIQLVWPLLLFTKQLIIFESHNKVSRTSMRFLESKVTTGRFVVGALTSAHMKNLGTKALESYVFQLPMAAPQNFFEPQSGIRDKNLVGYIGKGLSSGNDNGLITLLEHIEYCLARSSTLKFIFVGIESNFRKLMDIKISELKIDSSRIRFVEHVSHEEIPEYLGQINFGIIPYPQSNYNSQRFPIKAVEYSAAKINIIANKTNSLNNILSEDKATYFDIKDPKSLFEAITKINQDPEKAGVLLRNANAWALEHTYEARVKAAVKKVAKVSGTLA